VSTDLTQEGNVIQRIGAATEKATVPRLVLKVGTKQIGMKRVKCGDGCTIL